ncbi:MAG: hypothetical protein PGN11_18045 [Quadrisphaera sp.]
MVSQGVLEDLVGADRQLGRVAGEVVVAEVRLHRRDVLGQLVGHGDELRGALAVEETVLQAVQAGEVRVVDALLVPLGQPVDGLPEVAEAVVGRPDPLPGQLCGQPVATSGGEVTAPEVRLQRRDLRRELRKLAGGVGLVGVVRALEVVQRGRLHRQGRRRDCAARAAGHLHRG